MRTYWLRIADSGYLSYDNKPTMNIDDIRDLTLEEAKELQAVHKRSRICLVSFYYLPDE